MPWCTGGFSGTWIGFGSDCARLSFNDSFYQLTTGIGNILFVMDEKIDMDQQLEKVIIDSPLGSSTLSNVSFKEAFTTAVDQLRRIEESRFYQSATLYMGVKHLTGATSANLFYEHKIKSLKEETQIAERYLRSISNANSQEQLEYFEDNYFLELQGQGEKMEQQILKVKDQFAPWLLIEAKRKQSFYGSVQQYFSNKGAYNFSGKIGMRSPFRVFDSIELHCSLPLNSLKRKYTQYGLSWSEYVDRWGKISLKANKGLTQFFRDIDMHQMGFSASVQKNGETVEIQTCQREAYIYSDIVGKCLSNYHLPSRKNSIKYSRILEDTIKMNGVFSGQYREFKSEATIPFLSEAKFVRLQYCSRKFYDTYPLRSRFQNLLMRKLFWKSTLETNFHANIIGHFGMNKSMADFLEGLNLRGFDREDEPLRSVANLKSSFKFNLHNFPLLEEVTIVPFFYSQFALSLIKQRKMSALAVSPYLAASAGLGMSFYFGPVMQVELISNLLQLQSQLRRQPINFQIRVGVFD